MLTLIVLALVLTLAVIAVAVLIAVIVGIHSEPHFQMTAKAQRPLAAKVRRLLGVYVAKPTGSEADDREECLTGPSTDWWNKGSGGR